MTDKSHKTAISRKTLPLPTRWLLGRGLLKGVILDYGCGRCHDLNNLFFKADGYDPHYRKDGIEHSSYDVIICNFVLNVIENDAARQGVIDDIQYLLAPGGIAYISVRNDKKKLNGCTKRGTWQGIVVPPGSLIHMCPSYRLYKLDKE